MKNFEKDLSYVLKSTYGTEIKDANLKELYNAVSKAIMLDIYDDWKKDREKDEKRCGYMSAEFLIGRMIYSNMMNLDVSSEVKEVLEKNGGSYVCPLPDYTKPPINKY